MSFQHLLGLTAMLGIGFGLYGYARSKGWAPALAFGAAPPGLYTMALLSGLPVTPIVDSLMILVFAGGWAGLVLLSSQRLRRRARERPAARAAMVAGLALLAWFAVALLRTEADAASIMHQHGSQIAGGQGGQPSQERAIRYDLATAELRWRSLLPLRPACVTGAQEICARLDGLGVKGAGWREGLGPALIAASLSYALTLPAARRGRRLIGALLVAYGGGSAGVTLVESMGFLNLEPLSWLFVLPGTPHWPAAAPAQLALAAVLVAAGVGVQQGRRWGPALAVGYAAVVALLAAGLVVLSHNPGLLQWPTYATALSRSEAAAIARVLVPGVIVVVHLTPWGRGLLTSNDRS